MNNLVKTVRIGIIEDEEAHFVLIKRAIIQKMPHVSIHHFKSAGEFLEKFDEIDPDVIITDYSLPDMNGIELLEILNNEGSDIPVIMVTGQGNEMVAVRAMKLGVWDYLVKSDDFFNQLPRIIEKVVHERNLEVSLQKSEERFRSVFENSPVGIGLCDSEGQMLDANRAFLKIFGIYDVAKIKEVTIFDDTNMTDATRTQLFNGETVHYEAVYDFGLVNKIKLYDTKKTGTIDIDVLISRLGEKGNSSYPGYLVLIQDITERKRVHQDVRRLSQQLLQAQERERQMISRELHDKIAQDLSLLKIGCETLFENHTQSLDGIKQRVLELAEILQGTIMAVRDLSYDLRPPGLDQLGIESALYQYCKDFSEKNQLTIDFQTAGMDNLNLDPDIEINLYRLLQEGLNNIRKHADAGRAVIRLIASFPNIILRVEDDGKGFDLKERLARAKDEKRMGLRSMEERVGLLAGKMTVKSSPGAGTKIFIEFPYQENESGPQENRPDY
jgi:PAS domain S-box-containing protein